MRHDTLNLRGKILDLQIPVVMGIMNVTPDSFWSGSRLQSEEAIRVRTRQIIEEGGAIIDVGACSTRPGSQPVSCQEEMDRLRPALQIIRTEAPGVPISVDTYRADVARMAVEEYGVEIINDISGGQGDPEMYTTVGKLHAAYVLMHLEGGIEGMHQVVSYDPSVEVCVADYLRERVEHLRACGVKDIILDPGYGFSKSMDDHYRLLTHQREAFADLDLPVLLGFSRKRMIQSVLGVDAAHADVGTNILHTYALLEGLGQILRTHDVSMARQAIELTEHIRSFSTSVERQSQYLHWQRPLTSRAPHEL